MKALLIADDELVIERIQTALKENSYDVITYRWLIKAMDNVEEIEPDIIVISAESYPRHWKTLVQFVHSGISKSNPKIVLYSKRSFSEDEIKKTETLNITGIFNSLDNAGLQEMLDLILNKKGNNCALVFTNPLTGAFVTGTVLKSENNFIQFNPDTPSLVSALNLNTEISEATIKKQNSIEYIKVKVLSKTADNKKMELQVV